MFVLDNSTLPFFTNLAVGDILPYIWLDSDRVPWLTLSVPTSTTTTRPITAC